MKKLLLIPFLFFSLIGYSQMNTFGGIGLRVNDTTTYQTNAAAYHTAGYYDIYFNNQATNDHWDVWNGSSYDHIFSFGSGGGSGSGTVNSGNQYRIAYYIANGTTVGEAAAITAARALKSDANGVPTHFDTATEPSLTELSYVKGVTSAIQPQITNASIVGAQDLFITGPAFWPKYTNGSQFGTPFEVGGTATLMSLDFDQTAGESAQFQVSLPRNWNNGTVTCTVYWTATSGTGTVQWDISAVAFSNDDPLSGAFGTVVEIDDTLIATSDVHISPTSTAITIAGTPADGDLILFNIARDPTEDTLSADAKLLGVRVTITLDAGTSE